MYRRSDIMRKCLVIVIIVVLVVGALAAPSQKSGSCDRACLEGTVNQYHAAMVMHDASKTPFARTSDSIPQMGAL